MVRKDKDIDSSTIEKVHAALEASFNTAEDNFHRNDISSYQLSLALKSALTDVSNLAQKASTGFTNVFTCLAIKAAMPAVDIRYHQVQIQEKTDRPAGFNFRGLSEKVIYPWLAERNFEGAKSGWQTRTFERPKPYMLDYDENIGAIKNSFLRIFNEMEENAQPPDDALSFLIYLQLVHRESKRITLSVPRSKDISLIVGLLRQHFFHKYSNSHGASRLPVLALYATYTVLTRQLERYKGMVVKPLEEHSAADSQTGAIGDIEVIRDGDLQQVFEAVEVKHDIAVTDLIVKDAAKKIMDKSVDRYYVLTTHQKCEPDQDVLVQIQRVQNLYNCQLIVNGVIPTIKYYLRLLADPSEVLPIYVGLLETDH